MSSRLLTWTTHDEVHAAAMSFSCLENAAFGRAAVIQRMPRILVVILDAGSVSVTARRLESRLKGSLAVATTKWSSRNIGKVVRLCQVVFSKNDYACATISTDLLCYTFLFLTNQPKCTPRSRQLPQ
jgi:hypothetical protein